MGLPPGPRWPAVFQIISLVRSGQAFIDRAAERYGDLFTVRTLIFGTQVMTSDPELIKQAFTGDSDVLQAGAANSSAPMITGRLSVLTLDGTPHRRARKLLTPPFHGERMAAYAESMRAITRRVSSTWKVGERFSLSPAFQRITLEVIVATIFGLEDGPRRARFADKVAAMMNTAAMPLNAFFFVLPWLQKDLGPLTRWRFLPDRFLDKKIGPYTYFPFGGGPRRCLGAAFATMEMKVVIGTILRELELRLARAAPLAPAPRGVFIAPEGGTEVVLERARSS